MHTWNLQFIFTRMSKKVRYEDGGIVVGKSHDDGGVKFKVNGTNTKVELEGKEVVLSSRAFSDPKTYTYEGTNFEILNNINKAYGGNPLTKKVEELGVNDFVVCILSVQDPTVRKITGTNEQIISTINGTGGCVTTHKGQAAVDIIKKKYGQGGNISNVNGVTLKKVKSFTTEEGNFDIYDTEKDGARGRVDMFTVFKDKNGWIIRNAFVPDALQKKGIAADFYKRMNEASLKATKKPLRSTQERTLNSGEKVHELSANAIQLWESLVRNGFAEKLSEKNYRFVKQSKFKKGGEILKGGKADGMTLQAIAKHHKVTLREVYKQWNKGKKHEQEHTSNIGMASEIAKDHIYERLDYYDMLNKAESKYEKGGEIQNETQIYQKWSNLVNMSASEVEDFYDSEEGKVAGLSQEEAKEKGIGSGRQSARWIIRMKRTPKERWTPTMWEWAKRQISFISRMSGVQGELYNDKGEKTRKHLSLLIWGHNPNKKNSGGQVYESNQTTNMYTFRISENIPSEIKNSVTDIVKAINIQVKNNVYGYLIDRKNAKINILIKNELDEKKLSELEGFMTQTLKSRSVKEQYRMRTFDLYSNVVSIKFPIANFKTT